MGYVNGILIPVDSVSLVTNVLESRKGEPKMSEEQYQMLHDVLYKLNPGLFKEFLMFKEHRQREVNIDALIAQISIAVDLANEKVEEIKKLVNAR